MGRIEEFTQFARERTPALYRSALLLCGDAHLAEDLVQDTLAKLYVAWDRDILNPVAYAQTVLARTFVSSVRRRSSGERPTQLTIDRLHHDPDVGLRIDLLRALGTLKPRDRTIVVMRYLDDLSVEQVADVLGMSRGAVRVRAHRALASVREVLTDGGLLDAGMTEGSAS